MPRKQAQEHEERPAYISADGSIDFNLLFKFQPVQTVLLRNVLRNGHMYVQPVAPQCLSVGGIRAGKTLGWLLFGIMHYCLAYNKCDILVLRRTFKELESGAIADATRAGFVPKELFTYDSTRHVMTFMNGSRVVFGHCEHNKERDLAAYLGQAYAFIIIDECGQFSPDAWMRLYTRNTVNAGCEPDKYGNLPIPAMVGCSNPIGPHYEFYRTLWVQKEPWIKTEQARRDATNGTWWEPEGGNWRCIYDPRDYAYQRTTVLDNPELLARDPGILARLNSLPKAKRDKELLGLDGHSEGAYFDCFSEDYNVVNLREDPEAIIWQEWQPVWISQDWGVQHANAVHFFTKALVRYADTNDYKLKTVCFGEIVTTGGKTYRELASIVASRCKLPNGHIFKPRAHYFSHEKFARQMDAHSPADEYSRVLKSLGLVVVTPATRDRIGSASLMYNMLKGGDLVILDTCKEIILAIPTLMRDQLQLDDVQKTEAKGDDVYDSFRYGLFGYLNSRSRPTEETVKDRAKELAKTDPMAAHFYLLKKAAEEANRTVTFKAPEDPVWMHKDHW
jgi:hypothetical protein